MGGIALSPRASATRPLLAWATMIGGVAVAAILAQSKLPGWLEAIGKSSASRLLQGSFDASFTELAALVAVPAWIVLKMLAVIGVLFLLELRFAPVTRRRNLALAWIAQGLTLGIAVVMFAVISLWSGFPRALIQFEAGDSSAWLLLVLVPAFYLSLLVTSFFQYWFHRACHHSPLLWRFHAVHHSLDLSALNHFGHPVESVLGVLLTSLPTLLLIHVPTEQIPLLVGLAHLHGHVSHTRLPIHFGPLRFLMCDNHYHFIHHSRDPAHFDKNFANAPVWDIIFGTYVPAAPYLVPTGLAGRAPPQTFVQYLMGQLPSHDDLAALAGTTVLTSQPK